MKNENLLVEFGLAASRAYRIGAHPSASGNLSAVCEKPSIEAGVGEWIPVLGGALTKLRGMHLLITASGCHLANVEGNIAENTGIVEISSDGSHHRQVWGFNGGKNHPTSELDTHLRVQDVEPGVVHHSHPIGINTMMLCGRLETDLDANRMAILGATEGFAYVNGGIAVIQWCSPGNLEMGLKTAGAFAKGASAVLWHLHGMVTHASTLKGAIGLLETIEHAAVTVNNAWTHTNGNVRWLTLDQVGTMERQFNLPVRPAVRKMLEEGQPD